MKKITSLILALVLTFSLVALSACGDKTTDDKKAAASDDGCAAMISSCFPNTNSRKRSSNSCNVSPFRITSSVISVFSSNEANHFSNRS